MIEYSFLGDDEIRRLSKYCEFPVNEHDHPHLLFQSGSISLKHTSHLESLVFFSYNFYSVYTDRRRYNTTIPGIVDLIKAQDVGIFESPLTFMSPFLVDYSHSSSRLMPPRHHIFLSTKKDLMVAFIALSKSKHFKTRFTSFMGDRSATTCPQCCIYLIILMIKNSYLHYHHTYYTASVERHKCDMFNGYLTQVLLGCKPGIDKWERRHAYIHKTYVSMIETPHFLISLNTLVEQITNRLHISIHQQFFDQFSVQFWANVPSYVGGVHNPTDAIAAFMVNEGLWEKSEYDSKNHLHNLAIRIAFHHFLYDEKTIRRSFYHSWVDSNVSDSTFLVVFDRDNFPQVIFVRYTKRMISKISAYLHYSDTSKT